MIPTINILRRLSLIVCFLLGTSFLLLAVVGIFLPGVPTTGPLIAASFFLTKCNPRFEQWIRTHRMFASYSIYLDPSRKMPVRAKACAIGLMWCGILLSLLTFSDGLEDRNRFAVIMYSVGIIGTCFIALFRSTRDFAKFLCQFRLNNLVQQELFLHLPLYSLVAEEPWNWQRK